MANNPLMEMISASATGCMDKENYIQFKEYMQSGGEMPNGELGEMQNVISLIPTILEQEEPNPEIREEIGNRLLKVQKKIRSKSIEDRRQTRIKKPEKEFIQRAAHTKTFDIDDKRKRTQPHSSFKDAPLFSKAVHTLVGDYDSDDQGYERNWKINSILLWAFSIILLIFVVVSIIISNNKTDDLQDQLNSLNSELAALETELANSNEFINDYLEFIEFFNNPNINIIKLSGSAVNPNSSGRLMISFDAGEGLLQMKNMPRLESEETYQLWLVSNNQSYSLGTFEVRPGEKYMKISQIPYIPKEEIDLFRITNEMRDGVEIPRGQTYLFGTITIESKSTKRRRR
ncbi:MAG: anti-sigma factor [Melioribacteraceae bacterium]|nr:anti-sigma factor [Melioribacteraceae bacterium]